MTLVGRDEVADLRLATDDAASGRHAIIGYEKGLLSVTDLGSHNGVFVNGQKVTHADLAERDVVRFGRTLLLVAYEGASAHRDYLLDGSCAADTEAEAAERRARDFAGGLLIDRIASDLRRVAPSDVTVILRGETGTGKEVFARYVHTQSGRSGRLVAVNTSAIAQGLIEAELFGAVRGAFSGATQDRRGLVREAHRGTLFLDEIGDMPLEARARLLRVLQEREVQPVGASLPEKVDVRVVAATHQDLETLVRIGRFRGDLYARLKQHEVTLPPLRERIGDLVPLCRRLLAKHGRAEAGLSVSLVERLLQHPFPYNVRELEHLLTRALARLAPGKTLLSVADLPDELRAPASGALSPRSEEVPLAIEAMVPPTLGSPAATDSAGGDRPTPLVAEPDAEEGGDRGDVPSATLLRNLLSFNRGSVVSTAKALGVSRAKLYRWLTAHGIEASEYREA